MSEPGEQHSREGRAVGYRGMTKAEGDRIAYAVLELVRQLANQTTPKPLSVLDRNIRPEPPEATLGHMPHEHKGAA